MMFTEQVQRADLKLREKYPTITSQIYRVTGARFQIAVRDYFGSFQKLSEDFGHSICPVHIFIQLVENAPNEFEELISPINDQDIPYNFRGLHFNKYDVRNFIEGKFCGVTVVDVSDDSSILQVVLSGEGYDRNKIIKAVLELRIMDKVNIIDSTEINSKIRPPENPVFYIQSSNELNKLDLPFLRRDEELWFDNVEAIYRGVTKKTDLYFFNPKQKACFVNYSQFDHINIRNQLLLYDVVYCSLPLMGNLNDFFEKQSITRDDFLFLVQAGRVKVIVTQPEYRHEYDFFREIYDINPECIISRRGIAALCAIDIVSINNNYILNDPEIMPLVRPLIEAVAEVSGANPNNVANLFMWPSAALKASFEMLHMSSTKRISNYGVNGVVLQSIPEDLRKKIDFEFIVNSEAIHMAHALDATYFPHISDSSGYTDEPYALMMGNLLNFYKNFNKSNIADTLATDRLKDSGVRILDPINVIETNTYLPISDFEKVAGAKYIRRGFHSLFDELSVLETHERNDRIRQYNRELKEHLGFEGVKGGAFDLGIDATGIPLFGFGKRIGSLIYGKAKEKSRTFTEFAERIEAIANTSISGDPRITLLAKINRVARLIRL